MPQSFFLCSGKIFPSFQELPVFLCSSFVFVSFNKDLNLCFLFLPHVAFSRHACLCLFGCRLFERNRLLFLRFQVQVISMKPCFIHCRQVAKIVHVLTTERISIHAKEKVKMALSEQLLQPTLLCCYVKTVNRKSAIFVMCFEKGLIFLFWKFHENQTFCSYFRGH